MTSRMGVSIAKPRRVVASKARMGLPCRGMLARAILLAVPSLAMAVVGFAMFGPGAVRSYDGAQIWGGPTEGTRELSWRLLVLERFRGVDSTKDLGAVMVRA